MSSKQDPCCQRKRKPLDDPFFAAGDRLVFGNANSSGAFAFFYMEETELDTIQSDHEMSTQDSSSCCNKLVLYYPCPACNTVFETMAECESHYEERHVLVCSICDAILSSEYLLDLHLQEGHDSFFAAAVEQHRAQYRCLVQDCDVAGFQSATERLRHLQSQHGYPRWFRFIPKSKLVRQGGDSKSSDALKKKKKRLEKKGTGTLPRAIQQHEAEEGTMNDQNNTTMMEVDDNVQKKLKKQKRRERQKLKRASVPCRYYASSQGCWRGDSCMFLHSDQRSGVQDNSCGGGNTNSLGPLANDSRNEMMDLASDLESKATINVPDNISFGRRKFR